MTEAVVYRDATAADADAVALVARDTFIETFAHMYAMEDLDAFLGDRDRTPAGYVEHLASGSAIRLAEADGVPVGLAHICAPTLPFDPGDRRAVELSQLYIRTEWHGRGIAQALMDWAIAEARARGGQDLWLSVWADNPRARPFYRRYGFVDVQPYRFMVGNHPDEDIICRMALDA